MRNLSGIGSRASSPRENLDRNTLFYFSGLKLYLNDGIPNKNALFSKLIAVTINVYMNAQKFTLIELVLYFDDSDDQSRPIEATCQESGWKWLNL